MCLSQRQRLQRWKRQSVRWLNNSHPPLLVISAAQHVCNAAFCSKYYVCDRPESLCFLSHSLSQHLKLPLALTSFNVILHSSLLSPNHSPCPLPLKRSNSIQKSTDCSPDEHNYRGCCQCGHSGLKQTSKTPTPMKIEHLFKFSIHL